MIAEHTKLATTQTMPSMCNKAFRAVSYMTVEFISNISKTVSSPPLGGS
jgi:hypothetical protein